MLDVCTFKLWGFCYYSIIQPNLTNKYFSESKRKGEVVEEKAGKEEGRRRSVAMEVFTSFWVSVSNFEIWRLELIIMVLPSTSNTRRT